MSDDCVHIWLSSNDGAYRCQKCDVIYSGETAPFMPFVEARKFGVGMPAELYLHQFASHVLDVFPDSFGVYMCGSAMEHRQWRDVDVRVILSDADYAAWGFGDPRQAMYNPKWIALTMAFSELGRRMTGLPIDFQIDQQTYANEKHKGRRSAIGLVPHRFAKDQAVGTCNCPQGKFCGWCAEGKLGTLLPVAQALHDYLENKIGPGADIELLKRMADVKIAIDSKLAAEAGPRK